MLNLTVGSLADGVVHFRKFENDQATQSFDEVIAHPENPAEAATAYLYLALIAFNSLDAALAGKRFEAALSLDPACRLPREAAPRARQLFAEVQARWKPPPAPPPPAPSPPPQAEKPPPGEAPPLVEAMSEKPPEAAPPSAIEAPPPPPPGKGFRFKAPVALWAATVVLGAVAIGCGVAAQGAWNSARTAPTVSGANRELQQSSAFGISADVLLGTALAAGAAGTIVFFEEL